jgi:hypothetical protein
VRERGISEGLHCGSHGREKIAIQIEKAKKSLQLLNCPGPREIQKGRDVVRKRGDSTSIHSISEEIN